MNLLPAFTATRHSDLSAFENRVFCADALSLLRALPDASIDMVFFDPPYGHNNNNGDLIHRRESALGNGEHGAARIIANDGVEANDLLQQILPEIKRVLKPGSICCCCCGGGGGPDPQFARWSLWIDRVLQFKQMIIWDKGPMGMGWHYRRSYETVLVAQKAGAACKWYDTSKAIENIIRPYDLPCSKIIPVESNHPTEKPVELAEWFIRLHTKPGDVVLDCFAGSGSSLVAAKKLGCSYIGSDIGYHDRTGRLWSDIAQERIRNTDPYQATVLANGQKQLSLFEGVAV
jgi:DNA modification methylase